MMMLMLFHELNRQKCDEASRAVGRPCHVAHLPEFAGKGRRRGAGVAASAQDARGVLPAGEELASV